MEPQTTQSQPPKKSRTRVILIAVGVLVVLCLCVAVAGSLNRDSDAPGTAVQPTAQPIVEDKAPASTPTPIPPTATPIPAPVTGPSASKNTNLRAGPGTGFAVAGSVQAGEKLEIVGRSPAGDWLKLATGLWIVSGLVNDAPEVPVVEEPTAPATTATPIPPTDIPAPPAATPTLKQLIVDALGDRNRPDVPETTIVNNADSMAVVFPINDNLKTTWVRDVAQRDILNAAQVIYQTTGNAYDVTFTGTFAMQDAYGNVEELPVMRATLTRATLDKINWDNLLAVQLSQVADAYEENAGFSQ